MRLFLPFLDQKLTFLVINGVYDPTPLLIFEKLIR